MSKRPYSAIRKAGDFLFVSGQTGFNPDDGAIGESIEEQTEQTLKNIRSLLEQNGAKMDDVIKCSVFLSDTEEFKQMNSVYIKFFKDPPPARTTVGAQLASSKMKVEIDAIAYVSE